MSSNLSTSIYVVIGVAQVVILFFYFTNTYLKDKKKKEGKNAIAKEYPFEAMRNIALNAAPGAFLANTPENEILVYSVVMDWDMGYDIISLAVQISGDASLYVKSGGGVIGAGKYKNVSDAAQQLINTAREYLPNTSPAFDTALPAKNCVRFYLLTNIGKLTAMEEERVMENKASRWNLLFTEAQQVIAEMRKSAIAG